MKKLSELPLGAMFVSGEGNEVGVIRDRDGSHVWIERIGYVYTTGLIQWAEKPEQEIGVPDYPVTPLITLRPEVWIVNRLSEGGGVVPRAWKTIHAAISDIVKARGPIRDLAQGPDGASFWIGDEMYCVSKLTVV